MAFTGKYLPQIAPVDIQPRFIAYPLDQPLLRFIDIEQTLSVEVLPNYIPDAIRNDFIEAEAIVNLSPKASATLSRRCLQSMIRDFWGIPPTTLAKEIEAIADKLSQAERSALDALRTIGNIGAHPERDPALLVEVEQGEAETMLEVLRFLFRKWYIQRHDDEQTLSEINRIAKEKIAERTQSTVN